MPRGTRELVSWGLLLLRIHRADPAAPAFRDGSDVRPAVRGFSGRVLPTTTWPRRARAAAAIHSRQLEVLEVERPVEPATLPPEPFLATPERVARHVHHRKPEILYRGDARRGRQR